MHEHIDFTGDNLLLLLARPPDVIYTFTVAKQAYSFDKLSFARKFKLENLNHRIFISQALEPVTI